MSVKWAAYTLLNRIAGNPRDGSAVTGLVELRKVHLAPGSAILAECSEALLNAIDASVGGPSAASAAQKPQALPPCETIPIPDESAPQDIESTLIILDTETEAQEEPQAGDQRETHAGDQGETPAADAQEETQAAKRPRARPRGGGSAEAPCKRARAKTSG